MAGKKRSGGRRKSSGWTYIFAGICIALVFWFVLLPLMSIFLAPLFALWFRPATGIQCKLEIYVKEDLAKTTCDINVDLYTKDQSFAAPGGRTIQHPTFGMLYEGESATASSGKVTFAETYVTGMDIFVQARQAAPSSADPYMTPLRKITIPIDGVQEAGDTYSMGNLWVRDVSATAPTLTVKDQNDNAISDNTVNYINTTDTSITLTLSALDSDTWWGVETGDESLSLQGLNFPVLTDWQTGYKYANCFYWKGTVSQDITTPCLSFSDPTNIYYIFIVSGFCDDSNVQTDDKISWTVAFGSAIIADSTVVLDAFDVQRFDNIVSLQFSGKLNPTAITTKVA